MSEMGTEAGDDQAKPVVQLIGNDGNIFSIMGRVRKALRDAGLKASAEVYTKRVMGCGSYDEALQITMEYVEVE